MAVARPTLGHYCRRYPWAGEPHGIAKFHAGALAQSATNPNPDATGGGTGEKFPERAFLISNLPLQSRYVSAIAVI
jgi:hypothetical protein